MAMLRISKIRDGSSILSAPAIVARYSAKDAGQSVKLLPFGWLGALPRLVTIFCYNRIMMYIISQVLGWCATFARAGGMLAKKPMNIKLLVSLGNLGWMLSGILTGNIPLIASNALCLVIMLVELVRNKKK